MKQKPKAVKSVITKGTKINIDQCIVLVHIAYMKTRSELEKCKVDILHLQELGEDLSLKRCTDYIIALQDIARILQILSIHKVIPAYLLCIIFAFVLLEEKCLSQETTIFEHGRFNILGLNKASMQFRS